MNAINRFKEYFGMAPVATYEDEYLDDYDRSARHNAANHDYRGEYGYRGQSGYPDEAAAYRRRPAHDDRDEYVGAPVSRVAPGEENPLRGQRYRDPLEADNMSARRSTGVTRGAVALAPEADDFEDGLVTTAETVVERPRGFGDGKGLGEQFRAGRAVVLDLSAMPRDDARRMVDFAAGLVFGLDGRMQKVPDRERTFLLQPAGMDLTEAEIREAAKGAFRR